MTHNERDDDVRPEPQTGDAPPSEADKTDVEGHSMLLYEQARNHARERSREADAWAHKEALRRQAQERKPEPR